MASIDKVAVLAALYGEPVETDADDNQSVTMSRAELKQSVLDSLRDAGGSTRNHTHSRDLPSADDYRQAEADAAEAQQQEWFDSTRKRWGESSAMTMRPAGSEPMALNSDMQHLSNKLNNL